MQSDLVSLNPPPRLVLQNAGTGDCSGFAPQHIGPQTYRHDSSRDEQTKFLLNKISLGPNPHLDGSRKSHRS